MKSNLRNIIVEEANYLASRRILNAHGLRSWGDKERFKFHWRTALVTAIAVFLIMMTLYLVHG